MTTNQAKHSSTIARLEQLMRDEPDAAVAAVSFDEAQLIVKAWKSHENLRHIIRHLMTFAQSNPTNPGQLMLPITSDAVKIMREISQIHPDGKDIMIDEFSLENDAA